MKECELIKGGHTFRLLAVMDFKQSLSELTLPALLRKSVQFLNAGYKIGSLHFKNITVSYSNMNDQYNIPLFIYLFNISTFIYISYDSVLVV